MAGVLKYWNGSAWAEVEIAAPIGPTGPTGPTGATGATGAAGSVILSSSGSTVTVVNSSADTNLFSYSLSGSAVGDIIHVTATGSTLNNSGTTNAQTMNFKIGATTVLSSSSGNLTASATARRWYLDVYIYVVSLTSQRVGGTWALSSTSTTGWAAQQAILTGSNTSAEDLSTAKNLIFSVQLGAANNNYNCILEGYTIERLR